MKIILEDGDIITYTQTVYTVGSGKTGAYSSKSKCSVKNIYTKLETNELDSIKFFQMFGNEDEAYTMNSKISGLLGFNKRKCGTESAQIEVEMDEEKLYLHINGFKRTLDSLKSAESKNEYGNELTM